MVHTPPKAKSPGSRKTKSQSPDASRKSNKSPAQKSPAQKSPAQKSPAQKSPAQKSPGSLKKRKVQGAAVKKGGKGQKKRRAKPGKRAMQEVRKAQKSTRLVLAKAPFQRLACGRVYDLCTAPPRAYTKSALAVFQESVEAYAVRLLEHALLLQLHRKRMTLAAKDIEIVQRIRGELL
eukprot:TRINITY_DN11038_c0_g2_i1.p3 TRINITY_DN11038_c0_g2~~TRINITY_DN11038_c0_g2_i1.p3  ORF type:complete len:204 (+),score=84.84 TRINITY_DN11038_c0_g2_i1:79-612(+)